MNINACISFGLFDATKTVSREELPKPGEAVVFKIGDPTLASFGECRVETVQNPAFYCEQSLEDLDPQAIRALMDQLKKEGWEIHIT